MTHTNKISKFIFLIILILTCNVVYGANSEAEYKKLSKSFILNADGSQEMRYTMELTLFTHAAMNGTYGETFVVYNPDYQELKINSSYTKQKDGTIIKTPANAFVPGLPFAAAKAPAYNNLKEMVIVHTGLELGATIYLDYSLITKPGYLKELDIFESILQSSPVKEYTISISAPSSATINSFVANNSTKAITKSANGIQSMVWNFRNLNALPREPLMGVSNGDIPYLVATTYKTPDDALAYLFNQFNKSADGQLKTIAEEVTHNAKNDTEKVNAILDYVNSFDANRLSLQQTGYKLRPASAVIETSYGTEAEKTNLLNALLSAAGLQASPVALYQMSANNGIALSEIDHLLVECMIDGKSYLLNANSPMSYVPLSNSSLLKLKDGSAIEIPSNECAINSNISIDWAEGKSTITTKEIIGKSLLPLGASNEISSNNSSSYSLQNGFATLILPESSNGISSMSFLGTLNSARNTNIALPRIIDETYTYTITLPSKLNLSTPQKTVEVKNAAGIYVLNIKKIADNKIEVARSIKLNKQIYTPKEYSLLRQILINWYDNNERTLIISQK